MHNFHCIFRGLSALIVIGILGFASQFTLGFENSQKPKHNIFIARVIFAEAANASNEERSLIYSVIQNRINHIGFSRGRLNNVTDVVKQKNAFTSIGSNVNLNWDLSANVDKMNTKEKKIWQQCLKITTGKNPIVYYHDKSITKPKSWDNKYWTATKEIETHKFIFYSIMPTKRK